MTQEKHFYTISEVSEMCDVKPHVLRYWEKEFETLNPSTRRGKRRYYQAHDIEHIQTIRRLLYEEGFTINGARAKLNADKALASVTGQPPSTASTSHDSHIQQAIVSLEDILALL